MLEFINKNRKWWIVFAMSTCLSLIYLDQTGVALTLVNIQHSLNLSSTNIQWVINSYLLGLAVFMLLGGRLSDIFGPRKIFFLGMIIFLISSFICAASVISWELIIGRVLQGLGGALLIPTSIVLVANNVNHEESGKFIGICLSLASLFLALGPAIGGLITEIWSWRLFFWLNIPIGFLSMLLTIISLPKNQYKNKSEHIDWIGFFALSIALLSLILALTQSVNWGWHSLIIIGLFINFIIFISFFIIIELIIKAPLVNIKLFFNKNFLGGNLILLLLQICHVSSAVFWVFYLQNSLGYSIEKAGIFILPVTLPVIFCAQLSGRLLDYYGPRLPIVTGMIFSVFGVLWVAYFAHSYNYSMLFIGFLFYGLGAPLVIPASISTILSSVSVKDRGMASGMANTMRQIGAALGVSIIGSTITHIYDYKLNNFIAHSTGKIHLFNKEQLKNFLLDQNHHNMIINLSNRELLNIHQIVKESYTLAFSISMFLAAFLAGLALILSLTLIRKNHPTQEKLLPDRLKDCQYEPSRMASLPIRDSASIQKSEY